MTAGLARAGFDVDLRDGQAAEHAFVHALLQARVEVKNDEKARVTGNVFVEYKQKGRLSGIATSTADWWVFWLSRDCYVSIRRATLIALCKLAYKDPKCRRKGGDFNQYDGVLVPVKWLVQPWRIVGVGETA